MKKIFIILLLFLIIFTSCIFIFIPSKIFIKNSMTAGITRNGFNTCLHNLKKWEKWWPGRDSEENYNMSQDSLFSYQGSTYKLSRVVADGAEIQVQFKNLILPSKIQIIPRTGDSILVEWYTVLPGSYNPFSRLSEYFIAGELKKNMKSVLESLYRFTDKIENVYDFPIVRTTFTDTLLIAYKFMTAVYPTTKEIYQAINDMRQYISRHGAAENGYPLLNTKQIDSFTYETMIALCIGREIPDSKSYTNIRMVNMKDKFLTTEVTGGPLKLYQAHKAIEKYMSDYKSTAPARPFEVLVTDRSKESDTSKWKTKIFHPSM